jgi:hypothetical protein
LADQPILAGKKTVKFRSSAVKFCPVLTSVVKPGQGRKFFAGENGKETVKFFPRRRPPPSVHLPSASFVTLRHAPCADTPLYTLLSAEFSNNIAEKRNVGLELNRLGCQSHASSA